MMIAEPHSKDTVVSKAAEYLGCSPDEVETDPIPNIGYWSIDTVYDNGNYDYSAYYKYGDKTITVRWSTVSQTAY
jgi:hypothetical protein